MTTTRSNLLESGLAALAFARSVSTKLIEGIPADQSMLQPVPDANHLRWIAGHLAWTDDAFLTMVTGAESGIPADWGAKFGYGSTVSSDPADYPELDALREACDERRGALIAWLESLSDEELMQPLPENLASFAPSIAALMGTMAAHEGMHAGQLTIIRKCLKLERVLG